MNPMISMERSMTTLLAQFEGGSFWMPAPASTFAEGVDWLFYFILIVSAIFFVLILVAMAYFAIRYRRRPGHSAEQTATHSTALELTWTIIPAILVLAMFWYGFKTYIDMYTPPANAQQVNVFARKWAWSFEHPESGVIEDEGNVLTVPVDTPIELIITSEDVIHSFFVPAFRLKKDAVPGRFNKAWFTATMEGEFDLYCAEYCGTGHSTMFGKVIVLNQADYDAWVEAASQNPIELLSPEQFELYVNDFEEFQRLYGDQFPDLTQPAWALGERLYKGKGCNQCHTVDGTSLIGPSFQGIWAQTHNVVLPNGQTERVVVDENYFLESIRDPGAKIVAGYDNVMTAYSERRLNDREVLALVQYVKQLGQ